MPQFSAIAAEERMHLGAPEPRSPGSAWPVVAESVRQTGPRWGVATMWPELCVGVRSTVIEDEGDVHADVTGRCPTRRRAGAGRVAGDREIGRASCRERV